MLTVPSRPALAVSSYVNSRICPRVDPNNGGPQSNIISEPTVYEVVTTDSQLPASILTQILQFDKKNLSSNTNYATPSYTFGSVEFFLAGTFIGSNWITKERQFVQSAYNPFSSYFNSGLHIPAAVALATVTANGFLPSPYLLLKQPVRPDEPIQLIRLLWYSFLIIPKPTVVIQIVTPTSSIV